MWQSYLNGILVAAGLIIAIGAQNAFVLAQSLRREHHLSVAALCVFCDAVLVSLGVFGLAKLLLENPTLLAIARWGGIAFLTWYGLKALLRALRPDALGNAAETGPRSRKAVLLAALAVTLLNPHVYLDTVLLIGSLGAQQAAPGAYALGAASASLMWFFALALGAAWLAPLAGAPGHLAPARPDGGGHDAGHGRATAVPGITRFPSTRANPRAARQSRKNAAVFAGELAEARRSAPPPAFAPTVAAWICPDTGAMIRSSRHWEPRLRVAPGALSGALRRTSPGDPGRAPGQASDRPREPVAR